MASMFDFNGGNYTEGISLLAGNKIHNVIFKGMEYTTLEGKDNTKYNVIKIKFEGLNGGVFEDTIFEPTRKEDSVRQKSPQGWDNPSVVESITAKLRFVLKYTNPEKFKEISTGKTVFQPKSFKELGLVMAKLVEPGIGKEFKIKLLKKKKDGRAQFPMGYVALSKAGNLYMKNPFMASLDEALDFTEYEKSMIEKAENDTPTAMPSQNEDIGILNGAGVLSSEDIKKLDSIGDDSLLNDVDYSVLG